MTRDPLLTLLRILAVAAFVIPLQYAITADGPYPSVGLYWYSSTDPTTGAGMSAPLNQLLVRTDTPSIYYKSGASNTAWTKIGNGSGGGGGGGTVTDIACGTGISCSPSSPITTSGTVALNFPLNPCAGGSAFTATTSAGVATCSPFVSSVSCGAGLSCSPSPIVNTGSITLNLPANACSAGSAMVSNVANGTFSCAAFGSSSLTNSAGNNVIPKSNGTNLVASSVTDSGTLVQILTAAFAVPGNSAIFSNLGLTTLTPSILPSGNTDNYNPTNLATATVLILTSSGNASLRGIDATTFQDGRFLIIYNDNASSTISIIGSSGGSSANNQFLMYGGNASQAIPTKSSVLVMYRAGGVNKFLVLGTSRLPSLTVDGVTLLTGNPTLGAVQASVSTIWGRIVTSGTAPTATNGTVTTGSTNISGSVTGIGANTSTVVTFATAQATRSFCNITPHSAVFVSYVPAAGSFTASCFALSTGIAANCPDFTWTCTGN